MKFIFHLMIGYKDCYLQFTYIQNSTFSTFKTQSWFGADIDWPPFCCNMLLRYLIPSRSPLEKSANLWIIYPSRQVSLGGEVFCPQVCRLKLQTHKNNILLCTWITNRVKSVRVRFVSYFMSAAWGCRNWSLYLCCYVQWMFQMLKCYLLVWIKSDESCLPYFFCPTVTNCLSNGLQLPWF